MCARALCVGCYSLSFFTIIYLFIYFRRQYGAKVMRCYILKFMCTVVIDYFIDIPTYISYIPAYPRYVINNNMYPPYPFLTGPDSMSLLQPGTAATTQQSPFSHRIYELHKGKVSVDSVSCLDTVLNTTDVCFVAKNRPIVRYKKR